MSPPAAAKLGKTALDAIGAIAMNDNWYSAKCIFRHHAFGSTREVYEERIVLFRAASAEEAIRLAESEASTYAGNNDAEYLGYVDTFQLFSDPAAAGAEVYSLMRSSDLAPADFVTRHFDDGTQHSKTCASDTGSPR